MTVDRVNSATNGAVPRERPGLRTASAGDPIKIGFGTYGFEGEECRSAVSHALECGYRLFDCAEIYGNEHEVGEAFAASGVTRDELFVISKFWFTHNSPEDLRNALDLSLRKMQLDWFDLYMLHWPSDGMDLRAILDALAAEKSGGRIRQIGLCNFPLSWLRPLIEDGVGIDAVELEWHVYLEQSASHRLLSSHSIPFIAYCPLAQGRVTEDPVLAEIGRQHGVPASTVALAWLISHDGVTAIPKATSPAHQKANLAATRVSLSNDDLDRIAALPKDVRLANFAFSPPWDD